MISSEPAQHHQRLKVSGARRRQFSRGSTFEIDVFNDVPGFELNLGFVKSSAANQGQDPLSIIGRGSLALSISCSVGHQCNKGEFSY
jgi:hypothetical protein